MPTIPRPSLVRWRGAAALPGLLLTLTAVTGLVDAVSYLRLDHVFVANMTGNVVFIGFGLVGAVGISASASLVAIAAFLLGAVGGGRLIRRRGDHRGRHHTIAAAIGLPGLILALLIDLGWGVDAAAPRYLLTVVLAATMGLQNATARALAVPDLTTTVLTLTLTGLAADSRMGAGRASRPGRRWASVLAMFAGALVGALLVLKVTVAAALGLACLVRHRRGEVGAGRDRARLGRGPARHSGELRQFVLPYQAVRTAPDPDRALTEFSTPATRPPPNAATGTGRPWRTIPTAGVINGRRPPGPDRGARREPQRGFAASVDRRKGDMTVIFGAHVPLAPINAPKPR